MYKLIVLLVVGVAPWMGYPSQATAQTKEVKTCIEIPADAVGKTCEIVLKSKTSKSSETDTGSIVSYDDKFIVLRDATRTVRVENSVPVLAHIPFINKLFRNKSIGIEKVEGELKINRASIASVHVSSQASR